MRLWQAWSNFWFAPTNLFKVSLFRTGVGFTALILYTYRHFDLSFYFSEQGLVPHSSALPLIPSYYQPWMIWLPQDFSIIFGLHVFFLVLLFFLTIGLIGRELTWLVFILQVGFMQRNFAVVYGGDLIIAFWLFYLSFMNSTQYLSVRKFWRSLPPQKYVNDWFSSVGVRFVQIQLCVIYGFSGLEKIKGASWWNGTAVWELLGNTLILPADLSILAQLPLFIALATYSVLLYEVYFPVLVWLPKWRPWIIGFGLFFHMMTAVLMKIPFFALIMVVGYVFWPLKLARKT